MIGELFGGKYRVIRLLGRGGMGAVYEAEHVETGEHVALKCIDGSLVVPGKNSLVRFRREVKTTSAINSEHMVRVLDAGADPESKAPYMAMELLQGEDLQNLLDRIGSLEPDTALRIAAQVCLGLQKAHEARVVHRDIKPANIFLARRGEGEIVVKILDFGIAKIKPEPSLGGPTTALTRSGGILGSPLYMSPEQARGLSDIDYRTDIWSLGMVLYCAVTGTLPHRQITAFGDLIMAICSQAPPSIQLLAPWVEPDVAAVVHGALRLDAGERFPTAAAMLDAIRPLLPGGIALRDELLVPISPATRARVAARQLSVHAEDDVHQRISPIVVHAGAGDADETVTEDTIQAAGGPGGGAFDTIAESSPDTSSPRGGETIPQAKDTRAPRSRGSGKAAVVAGLVAVAGALALDLSGSSRDEASSAVSGLAAPVRSLAASAVNTGVSPASLPLEPERPSTTAPPGVKVPRGAEAPPGAKAPPGVKAPPGAKAPPGVKAPPGARATGAPTATASPAPPATAAPEDTLVPDKFE
ncbi:protein kinase [Sorangium sp. So ce315]|uniref:serine/threonine protein kinase n=1 Tax=Sorangium sp. So ce315 TaxID=3133299 RepID=UPI003F5DCFAF